MLLDKTLAELIPLLQDKTIKSTDLIHEAFITAQKNSSLNAFITLTSKDQALQAAAEIDAKRSGDTPPLAGIPFSLKDSYITANLQTTAGSQVLEGFIPPYDATVVKKLANQQTILIGKNNMDAWGHGGSTENTDFGIGKNPYDPSRVPGGSGGGPASAVATRSVAFAIGEDTGGSIRNPAAWCNVTGLKVTYGRVSRYGCVAYASSFDTVGPTAKTALDCAYVLAAIAGQDPYDATSSKAVVPDYVNICQQKLTKDLIIGIPKEFFGAGLNSEIKAAIMTAAKSLEALGIKLIEISLPILDYALTTYYLIAPSETSSNLARYDGIRYGQTRNQFTDETKRRIMIGTYALSAGYYDAYYRKAQKARSKLIEEYNKAFQSCDVMLMPVTPTPATKIGDLISDPLTNLLADIYTTSQNPVGVPALAIPCGFTGTGLPIGLQLVGKLFSEPLLLQIGHHYQQVTSWHNHKPN